MLRMEMQGGSKEGTGTEDEVNGLYVFIIHGDRRRGMRTKEQGIRKRRRLRKKLMDYVFSFIATEDNELGWECKGEGKEGD